MLACSLFQQWQVELFLEAPAKNRKFLVVTGSLGGSFTKITWQKGTGHRVTPAYLTSLPSVDLSRISMCIVLKLLMIALFTF